MQDPNLKKMEKSWTRQYKNQNKNFWILYTSNCNIKLCSIDHNRGSIEKIKGFDM